MIQFLKMCSLSGKVLNIFPLKENIITGIVAHSCSSTRVKPIDKQTIITLHECVALGSWEGQMAFPSHPCGDIFISRAFADRQLDACWLSWQPLGSDLWGNGRSVPGAEGAWGRQSLGGLKNTLGRRPVPHSERGAWARDRAECSVAAHWNLRLRY